MKSQKIKVQHLLHAIIFIAVLIPANSFSQTPNFTGEWKINEEKSELGEGRMRGATRLVIKHSDDEMSIERTSMGRSGEAFTSNEKMTLDGKECENMVNTRKKISSATWAEDGKSLNITSSMTFSRDGNTMEIKSTENWMLSAENELTIDAVTQTPRGERIRKIVYDKQ